jgi:hypothetical protein
VNGTDSGSWHLSGFDISSVEPSGSAAPSNPSQVPFG